MISLNCKNLENILVFKLKDKQFNVNDEIQSLIDKADLNFENLGDWEQINTLKTNSYKKIFVLYLGSEEELSAKSLEETMGKFLLTIRDKIKSLDIILNLKDDLVFYAAEAIGISLYHYEGIKKQTKPIKLENVNIICKNNAKEIDNGLKSAECINYARTLVNRPSNIVTPEFFTEEIKRLINGKQLEYEVIKGEELEKRGFLGIYSVGKGSNNIPYFNIVKYTGDESSDKYDAIIGKGITFDSGGISLKPSQGMKAMINDMAGAASALSITKYLIETNAKVNIITLIPLCENMPSSHSYKPGDVITMYNKLTVDIGSTDAEGRMLLADAISYAVELKADRIFEMSTLTGSCANFLGSISFGYHCVNDDLSIKLERCANEVGENIWRFPYFKEYKDILKTEYADLSNSVKSAGAIGASMFLQCFAENVPYVHMDIAGTACLNEPRGMYEKGATGTAVKTLTKLILNK